MVGCKVSLTLGYRVCSGAIGLTKQPSSMLAAAGCHVGPTLRAGWVDEITEALCWLCCVSSCKEDPNLGAEWDALMQELMATANSVSMVREMECGNGDECVDCCLQRK